jgi:hypothetical protein
MEGGFPVALPLIQRLTPWRINMLTSLQIGFGCSFARCDSLLERSKLWIGTNETAASVFLGQTAFARDRLQFSFGASGLGKQFFFAI